MKKKIYMKLLKINVAIIVLALLVVASFTTAVNIYEENNNQINNDHNEEKSEANPLDFEQDTSILFYYDCGYHNLGAPLTSGGPCWRGIPIPDSSTTVDVYAGGVLAGQFPINGEAMYCGPGFFYGPYINASPGLMWYCVVSHDGNTYITDIWGPFPSGTWDIGICCEDWSCCECDTLFVDVHGPYNGVANESIEFTSSVYGGVSPYNYSWDFGDGSILYEQNPAYNYIAAGIYTVNLTVSDIEGNCCSDTTTATIEILVADAKGPYYAVINEPIQFNSSVYGGVSPYNWHWDFGDGDTSNIRDPVYIYTAVGTYTVNLTVTDSQGDSDDDITIAMIISDPIAFWHLDEENGDMIHDLSGNNNNGTIYDANWITGISGSALDFDGNNDYVDCGTDISLDLGDRDFTISAWIKTTDDSNTGNSVDVILSNRPDCSGYYWNGYLFYLSKENIGLYTVEISSVTSVHGFIDVYDQNWHHVVGVRNGTNLSIFVDGVFDSGIDGPIRDVTNNRNTYLAYETYSDWDHFKGIIDEVCIYPNALTDNEIQILYKRYASPRIKHKSAIYTYIGSDFNITAEITDDTTLKENIIAYVNYRPIKCFEAHTPDGDWITIPMEYNEENMLHSGIIPAREIDRIYEKYGPDCAMIEYIIGAIDETENEAVTEIYHVEIT